MTANNISIVQWSNQVDLLNKNKSSAGFFVDTNRNTIKFFDSTLGIYEQITLMAGVSNVAGYRDGIA